MNRLREPGTYELSTEEQEIVEELLRRGAAREPALRIRVDDLVLEDGGAVVKPIVR